MKGLGLAQGPLRATGLQIATTAVGQAIPITYGYDRNTGRLIWWNNFNSSGGSSGFFGSGGTPPTYKVDTDILLGYGPMEGIADVWSNGLWYYIYSDMYTVTPGVISPGGSYSLTLPSSSTANPNGAPIVLVGGVFLGNVPYSESYNDFVFPGYSSSFSLSGNGIVPLNNNLFPAPNTKSYLFDGRPYAEYNSTYGSTTVNCVFPNGLPAGATINVIYYFDVHNDQPIPLLAALAGIGWEAELGSGSSGQPILYPEFSGIGGAQAYLGTSPVFPQTQFHTKGLFGLGFPCQQGALEGWITQTVPPITDMWASGDCNVADLLVDLITSGNDVTRFGINASWNHGAGFNNNAASIYQYSRYGGIIIDEAVGLGLNKVRNYCHAYSIYVSGTLADQTSLAQVLTDLSEISNSAPVWNGASLDFIPYCEVSSFGNGNNYVAPTAAGPIFTLTRSHFLTDIVKKGKRGSKPPVVHEGGIPQDNWNSLALNFKDRSGQTNNNTIIVSDAYDITRQGPMNQGHKSFPWIQIPNVAQNVGWALLRRNVTVNRNGVYKWGLPATWSPILTPMDLVELNEPTLSPNLIPVRITRIEEQDDFSIQCEGELFQYGASVPISPLLLQSTSGGGGSGGGNTNAGNVNTPIIFEAIPAIANQAQLWFCVSGGNGTSGAVVKLTLGNPGGGYSSPPTISFSGGGGSGASAICTIDYISGQVTSLTLISQGSGYTSIPSVIFSGGGGGGAAATASIGSTAQPYAGCVVMMSTDGGTTYNPINGNNASSTILGNQDMGSVYSSNFPSHADPDSTDTLNVDLTESFGTLVSFSAAQRDAFQSLCYLAGGGSVAGPNGTTLTIPYELVAYATATLAAANKYAIHGATTSIRRGVYNTPNPSHSIGTAFSFLEDGVVFKWNLPSTLIDVTLYFKFLSFATAGGTIEPISSATAYTFTPTGQVGFGQVTYTITPSPAVYQGQSGGWPGVDTNSTSWTNTAYVYVPPTTATFSSGKTTFYNARDSGFNVFTVSGGGEVAWVTVYDPSQVGETPGNPSLTMYCDISSSAPIRWTTPGYIRIGTITSKALSGGGGSGGGGGTGGAGAAYLISFFEGDATAAGPPVGAQVLLTHRIPSQMGGAAVNNVVLPQGLAGSTGGCKVNPTSAATITIKQNGSSIGTINISTGGVMSFTFSTAVTLSPNDTLDFINQSPADVTLAGIYFSISGVRN